MKRILFVMLVLVTCAAGAAAQEEPAPEEPKGFFGLDIYGGVMFHDYRDPAQLEDTKTHAGWDVDATVRFLPWLGVTGAVGGFSAVKDVWTYQVLVGPRFTTPIAYRLGGRVFAHALVGFAHPSGESVSETTTEWVVGGGWDLAVVIRVQVDYVRLNLNGLDRNQFRASVGLGLPMCFRNCGEWDGMPVGSARRKMHEPQK